MKENINTRTYWENRFSSGDWENKQGRSQTEEFAKQQTPFLKIKNDFEGTIVDFGCGLGDAMPVYKHHFPKAKLVGVDHSESAIKLCIQRYSSIASFIRGDCESVPIADVIIASNVFEHLTDDVAAAKHLLGKCESLYIVVPFRQWPLNGEHVNSYDNDYFAMLGECDRKVFACRGWSQYGKELWRDVYFKNIFRFLLRRRLRRRDLQIIFHFSKVANARTVSRKRVI